MTFFGLEKTIWFMSFFFFSMCKKMEKDAGVLKWQKNLYLCFSSQISFTYCILWYGASSHEYTINTLNQLPSAITICLHWRVSYVCLCSLLCLHMFSITVSGL